MATGFARLLGQPAFIRAAPVVSETPRDYGINPESSISVRAVILAASALLIWLD